MSLKPKENLELFKNFFGEKTSKKRVQAIIKKTKVTYAQVMREIVKRGLDDYEADND